MLPSCGDRTHTKERIRREWEAFNDNFGYRAFYQQIGNTLENTDHFFGDGPDVPFQNGKIVKGFLEIPKLTKSQPTSEDVEKKRGRPTKKTNDDLV